VPFRLEQVFGHKIGVPSLMAVRMEVQRRAQSSLPYYAGLAGLSSDWKSSDKEDGRTRE
jgi:hypothetical protein